MDFASGWASYAIGVGKCQRPKADSGRESLLEVFKLERAGCGTESLSGFALVGLELPEAEGDIGVFDTEEAERLCRLVLAGRFPLPESDSRRLGVEREFDLCILGRRCW